MIILITCEFGATLYNSQRYCTIQFLFYSTEWIELLFWTVWVSDLQYWFLSVATPLSDSQNLHSKTEVKLVIIVSVLTRPCQLYTAQWKPTQVQYIETEVCGGTYSLLSADMIPSEWVQFNSIIFTGYYIISILTPPLPPHLYSNEKVKQNLVARFLEYHS